MREVDDGRRRVAGEEMIGGQTVIGNLADHAADDRNLVGDSSRLWQVLAEDVAVLRPGHTEGTAILDRRFGLRIERLMLRKAAGQIELDHTECPSWPLAFWTRCRVRMTGRIFAARLQPQQLSERQTERSADPHLQYLSPRHRPISRTTSTVRGHMNLSRLLHPDYSWVEFREEPVSLFRLSRIRGEVHEIALKKVF